MFSLHLDRRHLGEESFYYRDFRTLDTDDPQIIAKIVLKFVASPIRWNTGYRRKTNFAAANWIGLDFDKGVSLESAVKTFAPYTHVIGVTRHHQLPKGKGAKLEPPCDRFRVFLLLPNAITDCREYEEVVRWYVSCHKADWQAIDGARKFNPCREIISVVEGEAIPIRKKKRYSETVKGPKYEGEGMPRWVAQLLQWGVAPGVSRNTACFKIAVHLKKAGFSHAQIVAMLMASPIPIGQEVRAEVETAVASGMRS